jgi:KUP system potassium uptake protein
MPVTVMRRHATAVTKSSGFDGEGDSVTHDDPHHRPHSSGTVPLAIGALGIVYGDLGTSPLYSIREAFVNEHHRLEVNELNVLGAMSIVLWTLVLIIAIKYVLLVMRADNKGEGGILALTALVTAGAGSADDRRRSSRPLVVLGLFGTALLFGDGMITPAISVLSAVEGGELVSSGLHRFVVPLSVVILVGLFAIQRFGTALVGRVFGPVMITWFATMAVLGVWSISRSPEVFAAISPTHAVRYFTTNTTKAFLSMGSLFLVVTGGEALYADMGHFGRRPISWGFYAVVLPSLLATYLGIGGLLLRDPAAIESPFFLLAPDALQLPLVILATAATIIASQALISGVFSLTYQGIQLGYIPRMRVVNTSSAARGQIYLPFVNWCLMAACVGLVLAFGSSASLAAAFGLSVTGTMFITTVLFAVYAARHWNWPPAVVWAIAAAILVVEGSFLVANAFKIPEGGWFPLVVGLVVFTLLTTWKTGRALVGARLRVDRICLDRLAESLGRQGSHAVHRIDGNAVYLFSQPGLVPPSLLANMRANGTLHREVHVVSVVTADDPIVVPARRLEMVDHGAGLRHVVLRYGFMERTPVAADLALHASIDPSLAYYFLGRESVLATEREGMMRWRERLFALMNRNAADVASYFELPADRVVEIGTRVDV